MVSRVLVGIDFSPASRQALEQASVWANRLQVPLVAMHVVDHPDQPLFRLYAPMGDPTWFHTAEPMAAEHLDQWIAPYSGTTQLIKTGNPAKRLVEESNSDTLLVVGNVGHGALDSLLFGSTSEKVVRHAHGDVLVVRTTPTT